MPYDVRKMWSQGGVSEDIQRGRGATDYYSVTGTPSEMANDRGVLTASGTGGAIPPVGASHPSHRDLRVGYKFAGPGLTERIVSVRYDWFPNGVPAEQQDSQKKPRVWWERLVTLEYQARNVQGLPITNSAGDAIDPPPQIEVSSRLLHVVREEDGYEPEIADRFENTVNSLIMIAAGRKFPPGTVRCVSILPVGEYTTDARRLDIEYVLEIRTRFARAPGAKVNNIDRNPFLFWHADVGLRSFYTEGPSLTPGDIYHKKVDASLGEQITSPVRLSLGAPLQISDFLVTSEGKIPATGRLLPPPPLGPVVERGIQNVVMLGWEIYRKENLLILGL